MIPRIRFIKVVAFYFVAAAGGLLWSFLRKSGQWKSCSSVTLKSDLSLKWLTAHHQNIPPDRRREGVAVRVGLPVAADAVVLAVVGSEPVVFYQRDLTGKVYLGDISTVTWFSPPPPLPWPLPLPLPLLLTENGQTEEWRCETDWQRQNRKEQSNNAPQTPGQVKWLTFP